MSEVIRPSATDIGLFMSEIGQFITPDSITEVYPGYFRNRRVFRIDKRVFKVRPNDGEANQEITKLRKLIPYYRNILPDLSDVEVFTRRSSPWSVVSMPFLGTNICHLATELDLVRLGYDDSPETFTGFTEPTIKTLLHELGRDQVDIEKQLGLIHGDIFQNNSPNNIVYNADINRLLMVDAEALAEPDNRRHQLFGDQVGRLRKWMFETLQN